MNWQATMDRALMVFGGAVRILRVTIAHPSVAARWHTEPPTPARLWEIAGLWALACTVIAIATGSGLVLTPSQVAFFVVAGSTEAAVRTVTAHLFAILLGGSGRVHAVMSVYATLLPAVATSIVIGFAVFEVVEVNAVYYLALLTPGLLVVPVLIGNLAAVHRLRVHRASLALVASMIVVGAATTLLVGLADRTTGPYQANRILMSPQENEADAIHRCVESSGGSSHLPGVYGAATKRLKGTFVDEGQLKLAIARTARCLGGIEPRFRRTTAMHASARTLLDAMGEDQDRRAAGTTLLDYTTDYLDAVALW